MKSVRQIVFDYLSDMNITYDIIEHPAVYTIEEMDNLSTLSFASESALDEILGLNKGAVTPFGILNDTKCMVEVILDNDIRYFHHIGIHPNDNTATVWIKPEDLEAVIKKHGNEFFYVEI